MNTTNENKPDGMNAQNATCGAGCCCSGSGSFSRARLLVGVFVLAVATVLAARAIIKHQRAAPQTAAAAFAMPAAAGTPAVVSNVAAPVAAAATPTESAVTEIGTLDELKTVAANTDAVFVFVPGTISAAPTAQMQAAAKTIAAKGSKVGVFILKTSSPDYKNLAAQVPVPCVLALVKGRGMSPVSGEITETKLVQGFVAASSASGCGPASSGCGPGGCN